MSTDQCRRLLAAYRHAQTRPVKVIVLGGPRDFFANGIHLNVIQAADDPGAESWRNINAMDDLVQVILTNTGQLTVAALAGNAAAGGLMLALAADQVWCRAGAVLNPHYRLMGLHGSLRQDDAGQRLWMKAHHLPHQDHRGPGSAGIREQRTKVGVCRHDDPILGCGKLHDPGVRRTRRIQVPHMYSVMPRCSQQFG